MTGKSETGTFAELNVKPGDVVECVSWHGIMCEVGKTYPVVSGFGIPGKTIGTRDSGGMWRIVSRASQPDTPKPLKDMTDAEIGALVRAHKEGKVIQAVGGGRSEWIDCDPQWRWDWAYRIRPETVREKVKVHWGKDWGFTIGGQSSRDTHRITFDLIDGKPDCASIRMEEM